MTAVPTIRRAHIASLGGAVWLGAAHLAVDAGCVSSVLRALPASDAVASAAFAFVVGYDVLAFAGQAPLGFMVDRFGLRRAAALVGLALTAAALLASPGAGLAVVLLAGFGNALFHVGAGAMVLAGSARRAAPAGVFVAPGALGLGLGVLLGRHFVTVPLWPLLLAVMVAPIAVWLVAMVTQVMPATKRTPETTGVGTAAVILGLLAFSVAIRSLAGTVGADGCPRGLALLVALPVVAFAGKLVGGFLADRWGFVDVAMVALLASAPLLAFSGGDPWLALAGLFVLQLTMPVTLAAALQTMPLWPGLGFGILTVGLIAGALPAYFPGGWRPSGVPLLLLVLASASALYLALRRLPNPCRGLP